MLRSYASPLILRSRLRTMATYIAPIHPGTPATKAIPSLKPDLWSTIPTPAKASAGTTRVFYNTPETKDVTALVSIGNDFNKKNVHVQKELVRKAVGGAVRALKDLSDEPRDALVDASLDPHAAGTSQSAQTYCPEDHHIHMFCSLPAVGAHLALYDFNLKTSPPSRFRLDLKEPISEKLNFKPLEASRDWDEGVVYARAQNFARTVGFCTLFMFLDSKNILKVDGTSWEYVNSDSEL
jgi:cytosol aminopeptidase